jgi:hypothetical protein
VTSWYPGLAGIQDRGFGGSRGGDPINGVVIHHTTSVAPSSSLNYVANANSRDSHPTYLIQNSGAAFGVVHPDRRPYSTAGRPDSEAVAFEVDNSGGAPSWPTSAAAKETLAQIIAYHYRNSPRWGHGIARNIPGVAQAEFFVAWHRQYLATTCPGEDMIAHLDSVIARAREIAHPSAPPIDPNVVVEAGRVVGVKAAFAVFSTAAAARAGAPVKATYPAGNYTVYKVDKGDAVNLTDTAGKAGGWAMISKVGLTTPAPLVYKVVFDDTPDDPTSDYAVVEVVEGKPVARPAVDPARSGFEFLGWYDLNGSTVEPYDFAKPVAGLLTIVARWAEIDPEPPIEEPPVEEPIDYGYWADEIAAQTERSLAGDATRQGALSGLFAGNDAGRKRAYLIYAGAALLISFGPDVVVANVLADNAVPTFVAYVSLASSILLKIGTALGFVAASNTVK